MKAASLWWCRSYFQRLCPYLQDISALILAFQKFTGCGSGKSKAANYLYIGRIVVVGMINVIRISMNTRLLEEERVIVKKAGFRDPFEQRKSFYCRITTELRFHFAHRFR